MKKIILMAMLLLSNSASTQEEVVLSSLEIIANKEHVRTIEKGKKVLIYFWAVWCKDCKKSLKTTLASLHKRGIPIFAINRDRNTKKAMHYIKKHNIPIPIYRDDSKSVSKKLKAFSVPHWAVARFQGDHKFSILKIASGGLNDALSHFQGDK